MQRTIKLTAVAAALLAFASSAQAGLTCSAAVSLLVNGTSACELGSTNNDSVARVNDDAMFGFTDWLFDGKDNDLNGVDEGANSLGLLLIGDTLAGDWTINPNAFSLYSDIMLVFKGGAGARTEPNTYVSYLLSGTGGLYESPFSNPNNGRTKNISHVSIYVRNGASQVGEPGVLMLFGLGALGVALARRRRHAAQ